MPNYQFTVYFENEVMRKRPYLTKEMCLRVVRSPIRVSRQEKGQVFRLPIEGTKFEVTSQERAVSVTTYLPEENCCYERTIAVVDGETIKESFERASKTPFEVSDAHLRGDGDGSIEIDADFVDRL